MENIRVQIIDRAIGLIETGWHKGTFCDKGNDYTVGLNKPNEPEKQPSCYCILGAISRATAELKGYKTFDVTIKDMDKKDIQNHCTAKLYSMGYLESLVTWNDTICKSSDEAIGLLKEVRTSMV